MKRNITLALGSAALAAIIASFTSIGLANDQVTTGDVAPEFELSDQNGQLHSLEDYRDQWVVLYFYPKDETPGCTTEACEFRDNIFAYRELNAQILGVSLDDAESHKAFAENHGLPFPLLADVDGEAALAYGVKTRWAGMTVAKRQTFLIGPDGKIARHYEKVVPAEHSAQVLADLRELATD
ncbi:MAG: peroxiredoxin [Gammaproteobacteria bacterium]|nr:peroxiredoxin [Gammaproteobacteria bacterium]MDH5618054.1 peroxiredoxin [Gammaproteobacteria bacterium]